MSRYLAADLGAESGRVMIGTFEGGKLALEELHRFPNAPVRLPTGLYWDTFRLFHDIVHGLSLAGQRRIAIRGIGIDTWGVDFGLLGPDGALIDCPRHYRDERTNGVPERLFEIASRDEVFSQTGIQFMQFNSLYQLYAMRLTDAPALHTAERLLFMPDLLNYWLSGAQRSDVTIASTSQFYNPRERRFAAAMLERLGIPSRILPEIVEPGTLLGPLLPHLAETTKLGPVNVYAIAGHDTASAVAAVPAQGGNWCYISSGTWSLMGVEADEPIVNGRSQAMNFTNEVGVGGKIRLLKNIAGLWLLQECRRAWAAEGREYSYEELTRLAADSGPAVSTIEVDAFLHPGQMPLKIAAWCRSKNVPVPETVGQFCRAILESLARRYAEVLGNLEELLGRRLNVIHIVGGGSKNRLLNQLVADATRRRVIAGPAEATALGNVLMQAIGAGELAGLNEAREAVKRSVEIEMFEPKA
jgi:rhamnulokinase